MPELIIRRAESDIDLEAWSQVRRVCLPDEPIGTLDQMRSMLAERVFLLGESDGKVVSHGVAADSSLADGFVMPRVLPDHRRRGFGSTMLKAIIDIQLEIGRRSVASHAQDEDALAFAIHHGFIEVDRQVEQVRTVTRQEPAAPPYPGVVFTTVEAHPDLLRRAYPLAQQGYADLALATGPADLSLGEWLRDEGTLPGGSIVALSDGEIVGYAGLTAWNDDDTRAENGLTVVDRAWRGRASVHGIAEIVTWTQDGNDAMRHVNTSLGYVTRSISRTVRRDLA